MKHKLIATPSRTTAIMKHYDLKMKKSLGQNFLIEPKILQKMVDISGITQKTTAIEIGPGIGALTEILAQNAKQVIAFEIDQRFIEILADTLSPYDNVQVIHSDILEVDFSAPAYSALMDEEDLVVVANLPYYITTPIIMNLMKSPLPFKKLVLLMQKEVAERMTAEIGTKQYNSLTLSIQNYMESQIEFIVPKSVFIPQPNVDSAVLSLTKREEPLVDVADPELFEQFVQAAFKQRRKTLWNNLRNATIEPLMSMEEPFIASALESIDIDKSVRAETLSIYDFEKIYRALIDSEG